MEKGKFLLVFLFISFSLSSFGQEREEDLAVPIFGGDLSEKERDFLAEVVREEAARLTSYRIMTKENVTVILRDKGIDPAGCTKTECAVEIGRDLQADKLVAGSVILIKGIYYIRLSLYDVSSASIDKSVSRECKNCEFDRIVSMVREMCNELFNAFAPLPERPSGKERWMPERFPEEVVRFESEPSGALLEINGKPECETPCSRLLREGRYRIAMKKAGYVPYEGSMDVQKGMEPFRVKLERDAGYIDVLYEPEGMSVYIDGENAGKTPLRKVELSPGTHTVLIKEEMGRFYEERINISLKRGERKELKGELIPREGAIKVYADDEMGNPVKADVYVDGKLIGKAPDTFRVIIGEHKVEVREGKRRASKSVYVKEKEVLPLNFRLKGGTVERVKKPVGILLYPILGYSFSDVKGLNYGAGFGYRTGVHPISIVIGMEYMRVSLSEDGRTADGNIFNASFILGVDFIRRGKLGVFSKFLPGYQKIEGELGSGNGGGVQFEGGIHSFLKPFYLSLGFFTDLTLTGIKFGIGGYF